MADQPTTYTNLQIPVEVRLPFNAQSQSAIIGHVLQNDKVFMQTAHRLQPSWFIDGHHSKIYTLILQAAKRADNNLPPNRAELEKFFAAEDQKEHAKLSNVVAKAVADSQQIRWEHLRPDLTEWMQAKILQETIRKSANFWNSGKWKETSLLMQDAVRQYSNASFDEGIEVSFDSPERWLEQSVIARQEALSTGSKLLDNALLEGSTTGGLMRGDTTVVLAPVNVGKTSLLLTIAAHNIRLGKDVLLMTHEGRPEDIRNKLMKAYLDMPEKDMLRLYSTPEGYQLIKAASEAMKRHLVYIPYNKAGMKVEDAAVIIRRVQEERKALAGKGFDLLVVDYPAKLSTEEAKTTLATRNILDIVYEYYVQLALEYNFHSLVAIQSNREGSKVNRGIDSNRLLMMEDVSEAWGPMASATNVITLNRSVNAKRKNRLTMYVAKSRSSETGAAIVCESNYLHGLTHSPKLKSCGYYGTSTMEGSIDGYLAQFNGLMIPQELVR